MNEPERPINTVHAFCSLILPGLGQLLQKRIGTAVGFFVLFLVSGFLPVLIVSLLFRDRFEYQPLRVHLLHMAVFGGLFFLFMAAIFWAAIDAAWKPEKKQEEAKEEKPNEKKAGCGGKIVELLVVISIIGVLVALLLPSVPVARESARRMQCSNHLKQIGIALHNYHDTYGSLPPAFTVDENGRPLHSWRVLLLPWLEQTALFKEIRLDEPWDSEYNRQFHSIRVDPFVCHSGGLPEILKREIKKARPKITTDMHCYYSVVIGADTAFPGAEPTRFADMTAGTSNIVVVVERLLPVCWMDPNNEIRFDVACDGINRKLEGIGSAHPGGVNVVFANASVHFIPDSVDADVWKNLLMRSNPMAARRDALGAAPSPAP